MKDRPGAGALLIMAIYVVVVILVGLHEQSAIQPAPAPGLEAPARVPAADYKLVLDLRKGGEGSRGAASRGE